MTAGSTIVSLDDGRRRFADRIAARRAAESEAVQREAGRIDQGLYGTGPFAVVPEPLTAALFGLGLFVLAARGRRASGGQR